MSESKKYDDDARQRHRQRIVVMQAAVSHIQRIQRETSQWGGSKEGREYIVRDRETMDRRLKELYFTSPCRFQGNIFRRRFRMRPHVFDRILHDVVNHDHYFVQTQDVVGRPSFSPEKKLTCAMRILAYGIPGDLCDEFLDITESTSMEILRNFTKAIWEVYHKEYLRRPTKADLRRLLDKAEKRGFPGMVGSLDCMHWQWKNCPFAWHGHFSGYKGKPTIILEAVASYDTWIWHAYFGLPGSLNDINVLGMSPLFDDICKGATPRVRYQVAGRDYGQGFYLVDGIYPKWGSFVKEIRNPVTAPQDHFTKMQEAYRNDVERAFGILQARFAIVKGPARGWSRHDLQYIMMTCIILHNMIVEDEREEDEEEPLELDENPTRPRKAQIYDINDDPTEVERDQLGEFMCRYEQIRCPIVHKSLQEYLVAHLWNIKMQEDVNH